MEPVLLVLLVVALATSGAILAMDDGDKRTYASFAPPVEAPSWFIDGIAMRDVL